MKTIDLSVQTRTTSGKGHNRRSRVGGVTPAVIYGKGLKAKSVSLTAVELKKVDRAIGHNVFMKLTVAGDAELTGKTVMLRDFQEHPLKHNLIHADFITVDLDKPLIVEV